MNKRKRYKGTIDWSEYKVAEGGRGYGLIKEFKSAGLKARKSDSPYIGQVGIEITYNNKKEAIKIAKILDYENVEFLI